MACNPTPTATQTSLVVANSFSTSFSNSVSTAPSSVATLVTPTCAVTANGTCVSTTDITAFSTIPGGLTTIQVPFPVTIPVTETALTTLFASCNGDQPSQPVVISQSTPPPIIMTSQSSSTLADGSVTVVVQTITSTLAASPVLSSSTIIPIVNQGGQSGPKHPPKELGAMIGGAIGGFLGLIGIVGLIWFILHRRQNWDDIFDKDEEDHHPKSPVRSRSRGSRFDLSVDTEPKPYQYGIVGQVNTPPPLSPPASTYQDLNADSTMSSRHGRHRSSLTPLMVPNSVSYPGPSVSTAGSSRPSTAGSMQPLRPSSRHSRPPSQQGHSQSSSQQGRPSSQRQHSSSSQTGRPSSQQGRPSSAQLNRSVSHGSRQHPDEFGVTSSSARPHTSPRQSPPLVPVNWNPYTDLYGDIVRNGETEGGPTSMHEPRILQLANPTPMSPDPVDARPPVIEGKIPVFSARGDRSSAVVVHTDGGRVDPEAPVAGGSQPPAYAI